MHSRTEYTDIYLYADRIKIFFFHGMLEDKIIIKARRLFFFVVLFYKPDNQGLYFQEEFSSWNLLRKMDKQKSYQVSYSHPLYRGFSVPLNSDYNY